jgi:hypothetical protein
VQPLLNEVQIQKLINGFKELVDMVPGGLPDVHWTSGRLESSDLRNFARQVIDNVVPEALQMYFNKDRIEFVGGVFLAKRPSPKSELVAHQDSSHTDESKFPSVYAWIALTDTSIINGGMHVIPGSHLWGNSFRSLNVPWLYSGFEEQLNNWVEPVTVRAGEVLFFDSALIHYSSNNASNEVRPALNYYLKPIEAPFVHYYMDGNSPVKQVEEYNVDVDFFYSHNFLQRPPCPPYKFEGAKDYCLTKPSLQQLEELYTAFYPTKQR